MIDWWLAKGVDGFRMDVINLISKDGLADGSEALAGAIGLRGIEHYFYGPRLHEYLAEMRRESFGRYDAVTVGETAGLGMQICPKCSPRRAARSWTWCSTSTRWRTRARPALTITGTTCAT